MGPGMIGAAFGVAQQVGSTIEQYSQQNAASSESKYNATVLSQQGIAESNTAAANEAGSIRQTGAVLGEQAAGAAGANVGTGGTIGGVEKQSATNARMDALNIWYGGTLERYQAFNAAAEQEYNAKVEKSNANNALIGGALALPGSAAKGYGLGTSMLMGGGSGYGGPGTGGILSGGI